MHIGTIVTAGIENKAFTRSLEEHGYSLISVDDIDAVLNITVPFDIMLIRGELLKEINHAVLEHLYFVNNSTPVALLFTDTTSIPATLIKKLQNSSLDILYDFEIEHETIYQRIDRFFINAKLNDHLTTLQEKFLMQKSLEKEISLREQILNHEREVNANIIASITAGLIIFDINGSTIVANEPVKQVLKNVSTDIIGSSYKALLPQEMSELVENVMHEMNAEDTRPYVKKCKIADTYYEVYCYRMLNYHNQPNGILMLINDITEQESMNVLLYRSEKLATVGTMLSGIAHELRNPLAIISARIQRALTKKTYEPEWLKKSFTSIQTQASRCASIVNSLLNFTRNTATNAGYHKIAEILDETLTYVDYQNTFDNISVEKEYDKDLMAYGDRSRFVQIFLNLITNAADAMEGNGTLTIRTSLESPYSTRIEINDSGPGMSEKIRAKIFDPFFTTKEPGKGTGLGLAIVYKIVQESNGRIWCQSHPGDTSFFVELPSEKERSYDSKNIARR